VAFIYEKCSERLLQYITGPDDKRSDPSIAALEREKSVTLEEAHAATWLERPFLNKINRGRFSIHQQEAAPFEVFNYITAPSRSKLALVLRHQTVQAVQFFAYFLP
jgi:hypothetical protein